ncbi:hypothetical protein BD324DRAFT_680841 [Kockovaella imperatae]|uniref:SET domain-containing protein n=1 Tax=Kockovaella imperatae TaxID=4999 RepID=A0A1Y1UJ12_9TREE|nr:hypothetical protein BD324DRAFT_680841 [Kockovaella imperatae]ORX37972.1 hypothetical protein BD324DRAFT_680841 [Kockovaella imperatae]
MDATSEDSVSVRLDPLSQQSETPDPSIFPVDPLPWWSNIKMVRNREADFDLETEDPLVLELKIKREKRKARRSYHSLSGKPCFTAITADNKSCFRTPSSLTALLETKVKVESASYAKDYKTLRSAPAPAPSNDDNDDSDIELLESAPESFSNRVLANLPQRHRARSVTILPRKRTSSDATSLFLDDPPDQPFEVVFIPSKGFGLRATRDISIGSVIVQEAPFLSYTAEEGHDTVKAWLNDSSMDDEDPTRAARLILFLSFTGTVPGIDDLVERILETNEIVCEERPSPKEDEGEESHMFSDDTTDEVDRLLDAKTFSKFGLFKYISMACHSCAPNAGWRWHEDQGQLALVAHRDIEAGQEITASYLDPPELRQSRDWRRDKLRNNFGFDCACDACALHDRDTALKRYRDLCAQWKFAASNDDALFEFVADKVDSLQIVEESLDLLDKLKRFQGREELFMLRFCIYAAWKDTVSAKNAATECFQYSCIVDGQKRAKWSDCAAYAEDPSRWQHWGMYHTKHQCYDDSDYEDLDDDEQKSERCHSPHPVSKRRRKRKIR